MSEIENVKAVQEKDKDSGSETVVDEQNIKQDLAGDCLANFVKRFGLKPEIIFLGVMLFPFFVVDVIQPIVRWIICLLGIVLSVIYYEKYLDYKLDEPFRVNKIMVDNWTNTFEDLTMSIDTNTKALADAVVDNTKIVGGVFDDVVACKEYVDKGVKDLRDIGGKTLAFIEQNVSKECLENKSDGTVVFNINKDGLLIHAETLENGVLQYMAEYNNGVISHSRTFNKDGRMTNECVFDGKGDVQKRITYKFDKDGDVKEVITE